MKNMSIIEISAFHLSETTLNKYIVSKINDAETAIGLPDYDVPSACEYYASAYCSYAIIDIRFATKWLTDNKYPDDLKNVINWAITKNAQFLMIPQLANHYDTDIDTTIVPELPLYSHWNKILITTTKPISIKLVDALSKYIDSKYDYENDEWSLQQFWVDKDNLDYVKNQLNEEGYKTAISFDTEDPNIDTSEVRITFYYDDAKNAANLLDLHNMPITFEMPDVVIVDELNLTEALSILSDNNITPISIE